MTHTAATMLTAFILMAFDTALKSRTRLSQSAYSIVVREILSPSTSKSLELVSKFLSTSLTR